MKKVPNCECLFVHRKLGLFLSVNVDDRKKDGTETSKSVQRKLVTDEEKRHPTQTLEGRTELDLVQDEPRDCWKKPIRRYKQPRTK